MSEVTLRSLAEELGVSTATISMVLNNKPGISDETRQRVLEHVKASGYKIRQYNTSAKRTKENTGLIIFKKHGKVVGDTPFFSRLIESIEHQADTEGYRISIKYMNSNSPLNDFDSGLQGLLVLATEMTDSDIYPFMKLSIPLVALDNGFHNLPLNTVSIDNIGGTGSATRHLIKCGHKKVGYMKSSVPIRNFEERYFAYTQALNDAGLEPTDVIELEPNMEGSYRNMMQWLSENNLRSTAFVGDNDFIVLGAIRALRENNIRLGRDISVVGFDDLPFARINEPTLTTVRVYNDIMGKSAFRRLTEVIQKPDAPYIHTQIGTSLKIRNSVTSI
jgi:DNA-binding LacI/PurR family transcriptional regulator